MATLLQVENLAVSYGVIRAVRGVSFAVEEGEVVTLIGANGAGKSSVLRAISGVVPHQGKVSYRGIDLRRHAPHELVAQGLAHVPEGRGIFPNLTVEENLRLAMWPNRRTRQAEQQQALRRAFGLLPRLILLDEPSMGLSPKVTRELFAALATINGQGVALLLVEQNAHLALNFASRGIVLENGVLALAGPARELAADAKVRAVYLGLARPGVGPL
jgi:branched-chain amino acid transport system ATP-binding protein